MYISNYLFIDLHPLISTIFPTMSGDPGAKSRPRPFQTFWWFNITLVIFIYIHNASNLQLCWVMLSVRYTALTPSKWWCLQPKYDEFIYSFFRESLQENWSVNPMFLVAVELKNTTHWENPQDKKEKDTSGKSTEEPMANFGNRSWSHSPAIPKCLGLGVRDVGHVTASHGCQGHRVAFAMQNAWLLSENMTILPRKLGILRGNIMT